MNNWNQAVIDLLNKGYTQYSLALKLKCSQPFISYLVHGQKDRVTYELGERIVALCKIEGITIQQKTPEAS